MDREGFRNRLKQYKKAREESPGLKYWEWKAQPAEKDIPKYGGGTGNVEEWDPRITAEGYDDKGYYAQAMNPLPEVTVVGSKTRSRSEIPIQFTYVNGYPEATAVTTDYNVAAGALERVYPEFDLLLGARAIKMLPTKAEKLGRFLANERIGQPVTPPLSPATSTYVPNKNHAKTSLKFFERPSKLTQEEQNGFLKHYRNRSRHSKQYGADFGKYDIRAQKSDSPIFSEFVGDGSESAVFSSKNNKWVYKIYDGASFNDLDELRKWTNNFLLRNKIDFAEPITYKGFVTSKQGIHPVFRQKKLTPISWNDPKMAEIQTKIKEMYKNAGWDDRMVKDGLQLNDMQIQNFAYDKLGNLKAIDVDVYPINGFADGGEVTGPPTYEDWQKSLIKNNLWMHPDYYMAHSLNTATKALKQASAKLPGREDMPPVPVPAEIKGEFPQEWVMNNLYNVENPRKKGVTKKYAKMYDSRTLGAGVDVVSGHPELYDKAKRFGIEKELADEIAYEHIVHDDQVIRDNYADIYGKAAADTLSFGPRFLVAQARYQQGNVRKGWDEIHKALAKGDAKALKKAVLKVTPEDHDYRKKWVKNFNVYGNEPE